MDRRCPWCEGDPQMMAYHDREWGVPERDDRALFEKLCLDGFQAGLSWRTILYKRDNYRRAMDGFDPARMAAWSEAKRARLMADAGIVRNRAKIAAAQKNARAYLALRERGRSFSDLLWGFVDGRTKVNRFRSTGQIPAETPQSRAMSKELQGLGFGFVGPTICYAFMQASGLVNDHLVGCFRHRAV